MAALQPGSIAAVLDSLAPDPARPRPASGASPPPLHRRATAAAMPPKRKRDDEKELTAEDFIVKPKKVPKDPKAPKNPTSSYMFFATDARIKITKKRPGLGFTELGRAVGKDWHAMSEKQRVPYDEKAEADKTRYAKEVRARPQHPTPLPQHPTLKPGSWQLAASSWQLPAGFTCRRIAHSCKLTAAVPADEEVHAVR